MAYVVWTCSGNIWSYVAGQYWDTFESWEEAEKFAAAHPDCLDDAIPKVKEDPKMAPGKSGAFGEYPETEEDYASFAAEPPLSALVALWKWSRRGGQWGHTPHWIAAALAAHADGDDERARKCLAIGFGYKDAIRGEEREQLFRTSRLLEWDDLRPGSRLNPVG